MIRKPYKLFAFFKYFSNYSPYKDGLINQSKYFIPKVSVQHFLSANYLEYKLVNEQIRLKVCPFCPKPHYNQATNLYCLNLHKDSGIFYCHRCQYKGSWIQFKQRILNVNVQHIMSQQMEIKQHDPNKRISNVQYFIYTNNIFKDEFVDVKQYLISRGFSQNTIKKYQIGAGVQQFWQNDNEVDVKVIYFPMYIFISRDSRAKKINDLLENDCEEGQNHQNMLTELVKVKIRGSSKQNKKFMRQYPAGAPPGFFGLNTIKTTDKFVVLTEGEFDAMAVSQATGFPAISLPQGAGNLPDVLLPHLDQFQKIYLWMDNDEAGRINEEKFSYKLGYNRTYIINSRKFQTQYKCKDANDWLLNSPQNMRKLIEQSKTISDKNLLTFSAMRQKIRSLIMKDQEFLGLKIKWFKYFNKKVKGLRMGQLSIVSGPTGCGKTTLLSQLTLDVCQNGVPVLWGSFQIRNQILITNMLTQFSTINLLKNKDKFDYYADAFTTLPLYYMSFYGATNIDKIINTIIYSIEKYNISVVAIDTLQFLISNQAEGFKKFDLQDRILSQLRRISIEYNIHVIIVIHPRKTEESEDIGIHSIYGTSKATQQADNIWILQNRDNFKIFQIKKNRYDGQMGKVAIGYNRQIKSFFQLKKHQLEKLYTNEITIEEIVEQRKQIGQEQIYLQDDSINNSIFRRNDKPYRK